MRTTILVGLVALGQGGCLISSTPRCSINNDCFSDEICTWDGYCEYALDRSYDVQIIDAVVGENNPVDGLPWNGIGAAPNLVIESGFEGISSSGCWTDVQWGTYRPYWGQWCAHYFAGNTNYLLNMWDARQGGGDVFATGWYWESDQQLLDLVRSDGRELLLRDDSGTVEMWIEVHQLAY